MINASGQNNQIPLHQRDAHPLIIPTPHIKEALAVKNIPDLLVLVQVFLEEHLDLVLVHLAHSRRRHAHLVPVLVAPLGGERVHIVDRWAVSVEYAQAGELGFGCLAPGVVGEALVALVLLG